jgi:L-Ala-D/L-Glu epimerase
MIGCATAIERWELLETFATARDSITHIPVLVASLTGRDGRRGWAEAAGVDYDGETPESMAAQVAAVVAALADDVSGEKLLGLLPPGGARNALDCALWDLRAKQSGVAVWQAAGLRPPRPVTTVLTIGLGEEADTRRKARAARNYPILKLKLDAVRHLDVVRIVREECPDVRLIVDANQAWSRPLLERLLPRLDELAVELVEQPLPRGEDAALDGLRASLPLAADESCIDRGSLAALVGRYRYVNIKLDKCGGLTEGLAMVREAQRLGLGLMVGNMCGTSLAMAPAFLIAQACRYVDLDGPLLQRLDRDPPIRFESGLMHVPERTLWG